MYVSELEIAPYIIRTLLFHLNIRIPYSVTIRATWADALHLRSELAKGDPKLIEDCLHDTQTYLVKGDSKRKL